MLMSRGSRERDDKDPTVTGWIGGRKGELGNVRDFFPLTVPE